MTEQNTAPEARLSPERVEEIHSRHKAMTPGPYRWALWGEHEGQTVVLYSTKEPETKVMGFEPWGAHSATPSFRHLKDPFMCRADDFLGQRDPLNPKRAEFDHPDAQGLAHSWADIDDLLREREALLAEMKILTAAAKVTCTELEEWSANAKQWMDAGQCWYKPQLFSLWAKAQQAATRLARAAGLIPTAPPEFVAAGPGHAPTYICAMDTCKLFGMTPAAGGGFALACGKSLHMAANIVHPPEDIPEGAIPCPHMTS